MNKRQNAMSYLFGRQMTEDDKAAAMAQARRLPKIILLEETLQEIKQEYAQQGKAPDAAQMHREASERVAGKLATQSPEALERIVQEEYARIIDEKKGGFFPPERHPNHLRKYFMALLETVAIAIWGSLFAVSRSRAGVGFSRYQYPGDCMPGRQPDASRDPLVFLFRDPAVSGFLSGVSMNL